MEKTVIHVPKELSPEVIVSSATCPGREVYFLQNVSFQQTSPEFSASDAISITEVWERKPSKGCNKKE